MHLVHCIENGPRRNCEDLRRAHIIAFLRAQSTAIISSECAACIPTRAQPNIQSVYGRDPAVKIGISRLKNYAFLISRCLRAIISAGNIPGLVIIRSRQATLASATNGSARFVLGHFPGRTLLSEAKSMLKEPVVDWGELANLLDTHEVAFTIVRTVLVH